MQNLKLYLIIVRLNSYKCAMQKGKSIPASPTVNIFNCITLLQHTKLPLIPFAVFLEIPNEHKPVSKDIKETKYRENDLPFKDFYTINLIEHRTSISLFLEMFNTIS